MKQTLSDFIEKEGVLRVESANQFNKVIKKLVDIGYYEKGYIFVLEATRPIYFCVKRRELMRSSEVGNRPVILASRFLQLLRDWEKERPIFVLTHSEEEYMKMFEHFYGPAYPDICMSKWSPKFPFFSLQDGWLYPEHVIAASSVKIDFGDYLRQLAAEEKKSNPTEIKKILMDIKTKVDDLLNKLS